MILNLFPDKQDFLTMLPDSLLISPCSPKPAQSQVIKDKDVTTKYHPLLDGDLLH